MWHLVPLLASLLAFSGTLMQAYVNLSRLKELDPEGTDSFNTVDGFKTEYRASRNPIRFDGHKHKASCDSSLRSRPPRLSSTTA